MLRTENPAVVCPGLPCPAAMFTARRSLGGNGVTMSPFGLHCSDSIMNASVSGGSVSARTTHAYENEAADANGVHTAPGTALAFS